MVEEENFWRIIGTEEDCHQSLVQGLVTDASARAGMDYSLEKKGG